MRAPRRNARTVIQPRLAAIVCMTLSIGVFAVPSTSQADQPPNPTDQQLSSAANQKAALATLVGQLSAQVAQQQAKVDQLNGQVEQAEQLVALTLSQLQDAKDSAASAKTNLVKANQEVENAKTAFSEFVSASYMSGPTGGVTAGLLTATDPSQLLQRNDYLKYNADTQLQTVSNLDKATVKQSNADATARGAVQKVAAATVAAQQAEQAAQVKLASAKDEQAQLEASVASSQTQLDAAQQQLADLNNQRAQYDNYQVQQAASFADQAAQARANQDVNGAKAAAAAAARAAAASHNNPDAQAQAARAAQEAQAAAAEAQARASRPKSSGNSGQGSGLRGSGASQAPNAGSWTAAEGQTAVDRAMQYLGWTYAWAGGNRSGPTRGVCAGDGAWNDCNIVGFDCSGLTLYGWAPYLSMPHYAASQYSVAGSLHPSYSSLMPGDLLFWSYDGTQSGIHHVAMYIGGGKVIQAPQSGDIIRITPMYQVSSGLFGATRPDT